jgi:hypothetical protein
MAAKDGKAVAQVLDSKRDHSEAPVRPFLNRDRKGAVEPPMAAKDGKAVAQVLDSKRDHSEALAPSAAPAQPTRPRLLGAA